MAIYTKSTEFGRLRLTELFLKAGKVVCLRSVQVTKDGSLAWTAADEAGVVLSGVVVSTSKIWRVTSI